MLFMPHMNKASVTDRVKPHAILGPVRQLGNLLGQETVLERKIAQMKYYLAFVEKKIHPKLLNFNLSLLPKITFW